MALVKFGGGIVQMTGSIAGNVFARNRYGNYVRSRTKPTNPNTALQQAVRTAMTELTQRWSGTVTAVQRIAWNLYGQSVSMKNRLGESTFLTGFNHYIRSNSLLQRDGHTIVDTGPTIFELPEKDVLFAISASEATQLVSVAFDDTMDWVDEDDAFMHVFCGSPQNPQRNFFAGPWRLMDTIDGDGTTPETSPKTMTAPFAITETQKLWCYARIQRADGRLSEPFRADAFVAS